MIYYPLPLQEQEAFRQIARSTGDLHESSRLASSVLSLPMHTELTREQQDIVIDRVKKFINRSIFNL